MVRISKIGIRQTAKFVAIFYLVVSFVFVLPIALLTITIGSFADDSMAVFGGIFGGSFLLLVPLIYAIIGFIMVVLISSIYNLIAKRIGGIEIEIDKITPEDRPKVKKN